MNGPPGMIVCQLSVFVFSSTIDYVCCVAYREILAMMATLEVMEHL